jgi:hypothetical protein
MIKKITLIALLFVTAISFAQTLINFEDFESGTFGAYNDGGTYCELLNSAPPNNDYAVKLTGGASSVNNTVYSNSYDLSTYTSVDITFDYQTSGYSGTDDFYLQYSTNGSTWTKVPSNGFNIDASGVQFTDNTQYLAQKVTITATFSVTTSFRFRSSATSGGTNSANDILYIDNIKIEGIGAVTPPTPTAEAIPENGVWRYLDNGSDQGTLWTGVAFDDSSWSFGSALFGYGTITGGTIITTINYGPDSNNKYRTTYFRKEFTIADKSIYQSIDLEAIRDDGMVVYLNGTEVWRNNIITGAIDYLTLAGTPSPGDNAIGGSDESAWLTKNIASTLLVDGVNTIAVEIHQQAITSSDISFNFKLTASTAIVSPIIRGPYLQSGTDTSVIIRWRTDTEGIGTKVNYGTSLGNLNSNVIGNPVAYGDQTGDKGYDGWNHEIKLTGLTANTKYYYSLEDNSGIYLAEDAEVYVYTAPAVGTKQFVRAWALGDAGTGNSDAKNVRDAYNNYVNNASTNPGKTDMMLFLGDNAYNDGHDYQFQTNFYDIYEANLKNSVAWSTLGNHESSYNGLALDPYYNMFTFPTAAEAGGVASGTEAYYSFDYANIHFIVLESLNVDGATNIFRDEQKTWLLADITNTTQDWIVAFFHHPPYTKGSHNSDNSGETGLFTMREHFLPILETNGVDLILNGHSHSYERSFFINWHYDVSITFNAGTHKMQTGDGKIGGDGKYLKTTNTNGGAVYVVTGSAGKISGTLTNHNAMHTSLYELGSSVIEIDSDGIGGQNLTLKFITDTGSINDYFTINKSSSTLSTETYEVDNNLIKLYPVPANSFINVAINTDEILKQVEFYNVVGSLVKVSKEKTINVRSLNTGMYMVQIITDKNRYYKSIIIE